MATPRARARRPSSPRASAVPAPVLHRLANGVRLLALPLPHVQSASVGVFLRVGSRDETPETSGISHVLEHMAFKGTRSRNVQAINLDAERLGADVNAFTSKDTTGYFMTGLGRHAEQLLRMTADIVLHSTFPPAELARELEVIRQEAIEYAEDPQESAADLLDRALWGEQPMGMPVIGSLENIERFTRADLVTHVEAHYLAGNTVVAAAGNFDLPAFLDLGERLFGGMRIGRADHESKVAPPDFVGAALGQRFSQVSQVFLNFAYPLAPVGMEAMRQARWRVAGSLAAMLFGGGMSAPLADTVRERMGLAYTAEASSEGGDAWLNFVVHAVTTPDKLAQLTETIGELLRAHARGFEPVQLERAKNQLMVSRVRSAERPYATMERAVEELFARGTVTSAADDISLIDAITQEEVRAVFANMLVQPPAWAMTGKGSTHKAARDMAARLAAITG